MTTLKTMTRVQLGAMGEALAVDYLTSMGLRILNRNWRCRYGELDVIACDAAPARWCSSRSRPAPATVMGGSRTR
ncbi:endonuclease [Mycobacterium tuberculosis]|nr:endonuclease [Mycobacterium tuberculosis]